MNENPLQMVFIDGDKYNDLVDRILKEGEKQFLEKLKNLDLENWMAAYLSDHGANPIQIIIN